MLNGKADIINILTYLLTYMMWVSVFYCEAKNSGSRHHDLVNTSPMERI